jgi:hypothetical protein
MPRFFFSNRDCMEHAHLLAKEARRFQRLYRLSLNSNVSNTLANLLSLKKQPQQFE